MTYPPSAPDSGPPFAPGSPAGPPPPAPTGGTAGYAPGNAGVYPPTTQFPAYAPVGPGTPPEVPKGGNGGLIAVIIAAVLLLCGGSVVAGMLGVSYLTDRAREAIADATNPAVTQEPPQPPPAPSEPSTPTEGATRVVYEVTGNGPVDVVYLDESGTKFVRGATLPWRQEASLDQSTLVSVVAYRTSGTSGEISCRATVDGKEVAQRTRSGPFAVASCIRVTIG